MAADLNLVRRVAGADRFLAIVATTRPDGTVHASLVNAGVLDDPIAPGTAVVGLVARGDARKLAYLRHSGRATVVFHAGWEWVSVEGPVRLIGPDDAVDGFDPAGLPRLLRDTFSAAGGSHDDWETYDRVMAAERRTAVLVTPARITSNG
jgi:PPOX class probable F420-dependent enzyme